MVLIQKVKFITIAFSVFFALIYMSSQIVAYAQNSMAHLTASDRHYDLRVDYHCLQECNMKDQYSPIQCDEMCGVE